MVLLFNSRKLLFLWAYVVFSSEGTGPKDKPNRSHETMYVFLHTVDSFQMAGFKQKPYFCPLDKL